MQWHDQCHRSGTFSASAHVRTLQGCRLLGQHVPILVGSHDDEAAIGQAGGHPAETYSAPRRRAPFDCCVTSARPESYDGCDSSQGARSAWQFMRISSRVSHCDSALLWILLGRSPASRRWGPRFRPSLAMRITASVEGACMSCAGSWGQRLWALVVLTDLDHRGFSPCGAAREMLPAPAIVPRLRPPHSRFLSSYLPVRMSSGHNQLVLHRQRGSLGAVGGC